MPPRRMTLAPLPGVSPGATPAELRTRLRASIEAGSLVVPGATDVMGLRLIQQAGFEAAYLTGAGLANVQYGLPDIGLISLAEVAEHIGRLANSTDLPLIADADTGYGGPLSVMRTVRLLERAGAAAVQLEDQEMPKRCGHFDEHVLIPAEQMVAKLTAAREAMEDPSTVLVARTDARGVYGIEEAVRRGKLYRDSGADVIFVEAPQTVEELSIIGDALAGVPLVVNVVEGGKTPHLSLNEYEELGFGIVLHANYLMRSMMFAGREALTHLSAHGETIGRTHRMASWQDRQALFNLNEFSAAEALYDRLGSESSGADS